MLFKKNYYIDDDIPKKTNNIKRIIIPTIIIIFTILLLVFCVNKKDNNKQVKDHNYYIELTGDYAIFEISVPKEWVGKTVGELDIRQKYSINIMALKDNGELNMKLGADTRFGENQSMLVLGNNHDIYKCFHI